MACFVTNFTVTFTIFRIPIRIMKWCWQEKTENPVLVPLHPVEVSQELGRSRKRYFVVRGSANDHLSRNTIRNCTQAVNSHLIDKAVCLLERPFSRCCTEEQPRFNLRVTLNTSVNCVGQMQSFRSNPCTKYTTVAWSGSLLVCFSALPGN